MIISDYKKNIIAGTMLLVLVLLIFRGAFDNSFVDWDDFTYVVNNDLVRDTKNTTIEDIFRRPVSSNYHPLTILSMRMNSNTCSDCREGISPAPFIRWNVILHAGNTILVFILVLLLTGRNIHAAFFVAAVFGIHPMHVESVAWISERKDVLYAFFFLSGLITYVKFKENTKYIWLAAAFLLFVMSCLSKAMAVVFPIAMILIDFWLERRNAVHTGTMIRNLGKSLVVASPFLIVSLFAGMLAYRLQNGQNFPGILEFARNTPDVVDVAGLSYWEKFRNASYGFTAYVIKFFAPFRLSAFYPYPGSKEFENSFYSTLLNLAPFAFLLILAGVLFSLKKTRLIVFGTGLYVATIILVLQFIPVGYAIIADRYSYLPYVGLAFIPAMLITQSVKYRKLLMSAAAAFLFMLFLLAVQQVRVWRNTESLWTSTIEKFPCAEIARRSRGKLYSKKALEASNASIRRNFEEKALDDFLTAIRSGSRNAEVFEGAGVIYGSRGEYEKAIRFLDTAVRLDSTNGSILYNRALTLGKAGRSKEAIIDYTKALEYSPEKALKIRTNRSNLLLREHMFAEAITDLDYLIKTDSRNFNFWYNRAVSRQFTSNITGAIDDYRQALMINPTDEAARKQLDELLKK